MYSHNSRNDDKKEDPPYSRLFVVCSKDLREDDITKPFAKFGDIEDVYMPRDRKSGESRGVAYIKYKKTSSAAAAIKAMHQTVLENTNKPIKVMIATNKTDKTDNIEEERLNRLFIKIPKQEADVELKRYFSGFGDVESVHIQKDKITEESKGLAYVQFKSFLDAAKAFEECEKRYKPVFATPKQDLKRTWDNSLTDFNDSFKSYNSNNRRENFNDNHNFHYRDHPHQNDFYPRNDHNALPLIPTGGEDYNGVLVTCTPAVPQKYIVSLFNIIPGMIQCQYSLDNYTGICRAEINYESYKSAAHAVERLNNFEFPSGPLLSVKPNNLLKKAATDLTNIVNNFKSAVDSGSPDLLQLADAIAQASSLIKAATAGRIESKKEVVDTNFCNVPLPPMQPMANTNRVAQRCFIVCKPQPPPLPALKDVFRRFGDLIDVSTFPNKTFGFVKYASVRAAQEAIQTLNKAIVCGMRIKVLEADESPGKDDHHKLDEDMDSFTESKKMRINSSQ